MKKLCKTRFPLLDIIPFFLFIVCLILSGAASAFGGWLYPLGETTDTPRFSDERVQLKSPSDTGNRPPLIYEGGDLFLGTGNLYEGFETPWGAVWQPQLWIFATMRSAVYYFDDGVQSPSAEWGNRLDIYANLQLTGTEKIILGMRPLDRNRLDRFSRVTFNDNRGGNEAEFNADIRTLFFEGDLGSLFPGLDPGGYKKLDYGFTVGRQLLLFQEGILLNDEIDAVGLVRNNIRLPGVSNLRTSLLYGWNEVGRSSAVNVNDTSTNIFGMFNSADTYFTTINLDLIYTKDANEQTDEDAFYVGLSAIQRIGHFNTAFRVNTSFSEGANSAQVGNGTLLSSEISFTPRSSDDVVYLNTFVSAGNFTQAGREPVVGGPLGALGILFASPSLGNFGSELNSFADDVVGFALGYEAFWQNHRRSLTLEVAGRKDITASGNGFDDIAVGFEFRQRLLHRLQLQIDGHYAFQESRDNGFGGRTELLYQF
ncbi:MAG: hypothetical protein NPINA01_01660 [Nitrospinaceae bacterium]|nr:MAG: hypothetical protein NPINA01_01660 [Nitrospinaceae bacterium]